MASTNPFQHGDANALDGIDETIADLGVRGRHARRAAGDGKAMSRRGKRAKDRKAALKATMSYGIPSWEGLRPVVLFLLFPGLLATGVALTGPWEIWILYGLAAIMGLYVLSTVFQGVELVLACLLLYLPFSSTYVIPVAPGVNGTNMLLLLGLFASLLAKMDGRLSWISWPKGTGIVFAYGFLTTLSGFTIMREPGGYAWLMHGEFLSYKAWVDQFILYFVALSCIRTTEQAKRFVVYMCLGAMILAVYAIPEMLDKAGGSSIDKSRIGGPHNQPNMFGGFLAYSMLPVAAIFVTFMHDIRIWIISPYFLLAAKILIATFSRGAYLAMAVGAFLAVYFRGKGFLILFGTLAVCVFLVFPSLFPQAIKDRLFGSPQEVEVIEVGPEKLDKSSEHRIILWRAGGKMILESPILGKGFKGFAKLKGQYTEKDVHESDPHNTYIYIASQMGLPALVLFLMLLGYSFHLGRTLSRNKEDLFIRAIGIGGASSTVCYAVICIFGSRAISLEFTCYFWAYLVCMQVINQQKNDEANPKKKKKRTNAFETRNSDDPVDGLPGMAPARAGSAAPVNSASDMLTNAGRRARKRSDLSLATAREKRRKLKHFRR